MKEHSGYIVEEEGGEMNEFFLIFSLGLVIFFGVETYRYRFRRLSSKQILNEQNKKYAKTE
ncbi:hypothetical protein BWD12_15110 [Leptospira santarosai serovar Bananal]|uniref:Uncharacterized protein n=1 Tax=Leptospira santarosai TaxID=28183 RepID=A0AB73M938_9LEPT|nr:Uncharacterized protein XB17_02852 [Leptospira santarosai]OLY59357.1 hypothetical protein BV917_15280 [Leptospira santarosai serovar Guaricura]OLY65166.1 hypothetical protein BWD11_04470 [Leptospira santarosai serovar Grippotyphosa]ONF77698.1 hypothetical protein BWD12_15110 [Leptospira santarosai serovar Bananal]ONF90208.1 hypothetical protein BWD14_19675 [Leptospira santarosai]